MIPDLSNLDIGAKRVAFEPEALAYLKRCEALRIPKGDVPFTAFLRWAHELSQLESADPESDLASHGLAFYEPDGGIYCKRTEPITVGRAKERTIGYLLRVIEDARLWLDDEDPETAPGLRQQIHTLRSEEPAAAKSVRELDRRALRNVLAAAKAYEWVLTVVPPVVERLRRGLAKRPWREWMQEYLLDRPEAQIVRSLMQQAKKLRS